MPLDLETVADPRFVLIAWAAGLTLVAGAISTARVVGPGFVWLAGGVGATIGLVGWTIEGSVWSRIALVVAGLGLVWARNSSFAGLLLLAAGVGYAVEAAFLGGLPLAFGAAVALGGVTGEMMLGHWYLIDPRLPRWSLRALAAIGIAGLIADGAILVFLGDLRPGGGRVAYLILLGTTVLLMAAVLGALRYPAYSGVMAATGLSYLAVLTGLGAVFLGRALVAGIGPFSS